MKKCPVQYWHALSFQIPSCCVKESAKFQPTRKCLATFQLLINLCVRFTQSTSTITSENLQNKYQGGIQSA